MRRSILLLVCLFPALAGAADHYHLARVLVTGSERYREDDLVRATGLKADSQVSADDLQNAANRLGNSGAFASVQFLFKPAVGTKGVEADFQVADAEHFLPAAFENFVWFSESELDQALRQSVPLYNGQIPTSGTLADEVNAALTKLLASRGLPSEVSYMLAAEFGQLPSVYKFKVGNASLPIQEVRVAGATHLPPEPMEKALAALKGTPYLRSDVLKVLEKNLVPLYRQHGYLKFSITGVTPKLEAENRVSVEVAASEGNQYKLGTYAWTGNTLVASDALSKCITVKAGEPLNAMQLDHDLAQAKKLFGKFGREGAIIKPVAAFSAETVSYSFEVTEGELYHMGKLEIEGIAPDQVLRLRQGWKLGEGEPYDNTYVHQFLEHTVLKVPGRRWEWMTFEQINDENKTVNVRLQVKIEQ